jgi:predicted ATPase
MDNIVIFGAPGSGKGTYSAALVEHFGFAHISTGDVLRGEIKADTELGRIAKGYMDQGQLIPDELIIDMLANVYDSKKGSKGVIFDGFPRTIAQAEALTLPPFITSQPFESIPSPSPVVPVTLMCNSPPFTVVTETPSSFVFIPSLPELIFIIPPFIVR